MSTTPLKSDEILKRAHAVGTYYGFTPFSILAAAKKGSSAKSPYPENFQLESLDPTARDVVGLLKQVRDAGITPSLLQPLFVWHTNAAHGRPAPKEIVIQFHAIGVNRAIADAVLIRALRSLITDLSHAEPTVRINSMGDKETRGRFARELGTYFRKNGATLPTECTSCAKNDVFEAAEIMVKREDCSSSFPSPTEHLSEASRKHFEDVLEYLEATETPYELAPNLLSKGGAWTDTCFEVVTPTMRAWGSRYSEITKPFFKSSVPSVGAVIRIQSVGREVLSPIKTRPRARFVFVHIGDDAKRESMKMADTLRHARLPITQSIGVESLTEQMRLAEIINPEYLLIMGRKEALERSVILRERSTHTETFIPLEFLIDRLRDVV